MTTALGTRKRAWDVGRKGHDTYEWAACRDCGLQRWTIVTKGSVRPRCRRCGTLPYNQSRRHPNSPFWKGGHLRDNGYVLIYIPDGHPLEAMRTSGRRYILEHRLVMAESLGRCLSSDEIVHHKDGVRSNNDIHNLELTRRGAHSRQHSKGYQDGFSQGYADGLNTARKEIA